jgi:ATP-dependent DNA ligase
VRSCLIDGEAIVSDESGLAAFDLVRSWPTNLSAVLCAFDLLEVDGEDLCRLPIEQRASDAASFVNGVDEKCTDRPVAMVCCRKTLDWSVFFPNPKR